MKKWDESSCIEAIHNFYEINKRIPQRREFKNKPSGATVTSVFGSWNNAIEAAGFDTFSKQKWDKESILTKIKEFYSLENRIPQALDFDNNKSFPGFSTVQRHFGTWNKAIEAAGFIANYNTSFGNNTIAKDGILYRSIAEAYFVDNYLYDKYAYIYEPRYKNKLWKYDFYLPKLDLYIEINGELDTDEYTNRIKEKIDYNSKNNINCLFLIRKIIYNKERMREYL